MRHLEVDVAVIGAGTAGLAAYRAAVAVGKRTLIIEGGPHGTTCARVGCMPSKLLIAAAEAAHAAARWPCSAPASSASSSARRSTGWVCACTCSAGEARSGPSATRPCANTRCAASRTSSISIPMRRCCAWSARRTVWRSTSSIPTAAPGRSEGLRTALRDAQAKLSAARPAQVLAAA